MYGRKYTANIKTLTAAATTRNLAMFIVIAAY